MKLDLTKKTGFRNINYREPIIIRDHRNIPFYDSRYLSKPVKFFNLPKGRYNVISGQITETLQPREYQKFTLPKAKRNRPLPQDFKVIFTDTPHKALVDWDNKEIVFDNYFKTRPLPEVMFIFFHEMGHSKWGGYIPGSKQYNDAEHYCDMFSHNMMLDEGYNPSQIGLSPVNSLSDRQPTRKKRLLTKMKIHEIS
jgi:hypothetical protein